ncbi:MAG: diguanylate cyclase [Actinomycetota bacterium]|nr:diguanylate cyclase [Actinomycetota bacterium]
MSFRARLTTFFLLIVVIPMGAMGLLVFRLINDSQRSNEVARANGVASVADSVYEHASRSASADARALARALGGTEGPALRARAVALASKAGIVRVTVVDGRRTVLDVGSRSAVAPGTASLQPLGQRPPRTVTISALTAAQYAGQLSSHAVQIVVRQGSRTLGSTLPAARARAFRRSGPVQLAGTSYRSVTLGLGGFRGARVSVTVLSAASATDGAPASDRLVAGLFIVGFLILAFGFSLLASRALQGQLADFLAAARRLARGDFSSPVPTNGNDEFAALGDEFNNMSRQLANRLDELKSEQVRLRRSIRHIGDAFAANLDREALLRLALRTAMDATGCDRGRLSAREQADEPLAEVVRFGRLDGLEPAIQESERAALDDDGTGQAWTKERTMATVALGSIAAGEPTHGLITVCRAGSSFTEDDLDLLRSLAARATLALANVNLHFDVQRQAVTDDLTGLATHGHFQELLGMAMEEVRRYRYPVGLAMLDIDDFKSINDVYGHLQGDVVLRHVAEVLRETSRDADVAARYGGEELALILPHTDLEGTYVIAERAREAIQALKVPLLGGDGALQITASVGVASSSAGHKDELIAAADNALYTAKRGGKNRTVKAGSETATALGGR